MSDAVILPLRVKAQPQPAICEGGDCGFCVLAGLMQCPVQEAYDRLYPEGRPECFGYHEMVQALYRLRHEGLLKRIITAVPLWPGRDSYRFWGDPSWCQNLRWFDYMRMAFEGGYYGLAMVHLDQGGALDPHACPDHFVLLCGARTNSGKHGRRQQILVSCSSTKTPAEEWVEVTGLLQQRGGFNAILVKPVSAGD